MQVHASRAPHIWRWAGLLLACCCLSCSSDSGLQPVQGKVLYKNQPIAGALVTFHPKGATDVRTLRPVGMTKEDGTFTLTTGDKEGAPAGVGAYVDGVTRANIARIAC